MDIREHQRIADGGYIDESMAEYYPHEYDAAADEHAYAGPGTSTSARGGRLAKQKQQQQAPFSPRRGPGLYGGEDFESQLDEYGYLPGEREERQRRRRAALRLEKSPEIDEYGHLIGSAAAGRKREADAQKTGHKKRRS
ncbi:MAG: hypothetical protein Q9222_007715, partial [Ikaeria aurantiellina]